MEKLSFPRETFRNDFGLGIDSGGTCLKLVYTTVEADQTQFHFTNFHKDDYKEAVAFIKETCGKELVSGQTVRCCGMSAGNLVGCMKEELNVKLEIGYESTDIVDAIRFLYCHLPWNTFIIAPSPQATQRGMNQTRGLAQIYQSIQEVEPRLRPVEDVLADDKAPEELIYPFIVYTAGSVNGATMVYEDGTYSFRTWNPSSGKSFLGLGRLLTGIKDFAGILELAESGDNTKIDSMMEDVAGSSDDAVYGSLEDDGSHSKSGVKVYCFGHLSRSEYEDGEADKADVMAALLSSYCQSIAMDACMWAAATRTKQVFFSGSFVGASDVIRDQIATFYTLESHSSILSHKSYPYFVRHGSHIAGIGTLLANLEIKE